MKISLNLRDKAMQQTLDFMMSFCRDKVPGHGEDSYCYSFCDHAGLLAVFDGCGGAGAKTHGKYSGHTEAYVASRLCAGAFYDSFRNQFSAGSSAHELASSIFAPCVQERLSKYSPPKNENGIKISGSGIRTLPTTAAAAMIRQQASGTAEVSAIWAGDSRVYVQDGKGLAQLTTDHTSEPDPMITIYEDGVLRNVLCADRPVQLSCKTVQLQEPFVVFAATDGCFGYLSTPMEFEGVLLQSLLNADCVAQWEQTLANAISAVAGDDHTLCLAAYGYGSFEKLQNSFRGRWNEIEKAYLQPVSVLPVEDRDSRYDLWLNYKNNYMRYL